MASQEYPLLDVVPPPPVVLPPPEVEVGSTIAVGVSTGATAVGVSTTGTVAVGSGVSVAGGWAWAVSRFWEATVNATEVAIWLLTRLGSAVGAGAGAHAASRSTMGMVVKRTCLMVLFMLFSLNGCDYSFGLEEPSP